MKRHLVVFDDGSDPFLDLQPFVDSLDGDAQFLTLDGHVCFVKSALSASEISDRFLNIAGSRLFFVADVSSAPYAGRMIGAFWDFYKQPKRVALQTAAE